MRDFYRRTMMNRWHELLDLSPDAQRLYFYAFTGPASMEYGLVALHLGQTRRDLKLTDATLAAAIHELGGFCAQSSGSVRRTVVLCDPELARAIAPRAPNNHIAMVRAMAAIPKGAARDAWEACLKHPVAQLPESTGNRGATRRQPVGNPSPTKKEKEKEKEKENKTRKTRKRARVFVPPTLDEAKAWAKSKGWGEKFAADFYGYFTTDEDNPWVDSRGNPVKSWKQKMQTWANRGATDGRKDTARRDPRGETIEELEAFYAERG